MSARKCVSPGTPEYGRLMQEHRDVVRVWGVRLPNPEPELLAARARDWAKQTVEAMRARNPRLWSRNKYGVGWVEAFTIGQIGAELLGQQYRTTADWTVRGTSDPGFDLTLATQPPILLDVKTRQAWLTLRAEEIKTACRASYYALVNYDDAGYIFCGVLRPVDFAPPVRFPAWTGAPVEAVTAAALIRPAHFHPWEM